VLGRSPGFRRRVGTPPVRPFTAVRPTRALRPIEASKTMVCYVRSTSTPAVCGAIMRRCRCRRAAGCRPRLLAIPPFKSERARVIGAGMSAFSGCSTTSVEGASLRGTPAPVQAPKTASLLVSRQWPWTCAVATSSTSWRRWRGRPPRQERMSSPARMATSHLSSASARFAWLAGILQIAALISTVEAAERKSGSSWVSVGPAPSF